MRCNSLFQRSIKKCLQQPLKRGLAGALTLASRVIDKLAAALLVLQMPFLFEDTQQCPHGSAGWSIAQVIEHVGGSGFFPGVDNLHNLAFPPAKAVEFTHKSLDGRWRIAPQLLK